MSSNSNNGAPLTSAVIFAKMPEAFRSEKAQDLKAVFQFNLSGENGGQWQVIVEEGTCQVEAEGERAPDVTFSMSAADHVALIDRTLNPQMAFMTGRIKVDGDLFLALRFTELFRTE